MPYPGCDGLDVDELIARNADSVWLHQHEMWELITPDDEKGTDRRPEWETDNVF
ncbi:MAG: hypothetical protein ABI614_24790 [Planctomycetota bacterium]